MMGRRNNSGRSVALLTAALAQAIGKSGKLEIPKAPPAVKPLIDPSEREAAEKKMTDDFIHIASCNYPVTVSSADYDERKAGRRSAESGYLHRVKPAAYVEPEWRPSKRWRKKHGSN